ncbi:solute carrier family 35 member G1-like [Saccoglossus kowalevskii]|uniref:Solute carrier family 35 member G1-like n=1 Tax=Saccoglossus kowalevskii TaxID=10224 RepID=A0ABM0MPN9_SACKO|nr:PREDICTED: solute carrier family 35 member G1-like [Saccoglossus kowalevskii]
MDLRSGYYDMDKLGNDMGKLGKDTNQLETMGNEEDKNATSTQDRTINSWVGIALAFLYGVCSAVGAMFIIWAQNGGASQFQIAFITQLVVTIVAVIAIIIKKISISSDNFCDTFLILGNGMIRALAEIAIYYALPRAPLGNIMVIVYGGIPIITSIFSWLCLKEKCRCTDIIAFFLVVLGVLMIARPDFFLQPRNPELAREEDIAYICAAIGSIGLATSLLITRSIGESVHPITTMFYYGIISALLNAIILVFITTSQDWDLPSFAWWSLLGACIFVTLSDWSLFSALQLETATTVVLIGEVQICITYILDLFVLNNVLDVLDFVGAALVLAASLIVAIASCWSNKTKKEDNELQQLVIKDAKQK